MNWKKVLITAVIVFIIGFLLGFIPQYRKASNLQTDLDAAQLTGELAHIRELAALSLAEASRMNYGSAAVDSERMFNLVNETANQHTKETGLHDTLENLLTFRNTVESKLKNGDNNVLDPLQQIVQKTQANLKR